MKKSSLYELENYGYLISGSPKLGYYEIKQTNLKRQLGFTVLTLSVCLIVGAFIYLALYDQTGFNPTLVVSMYTSGPFLFLVGIGLIFAHRMRKVKLDFNENNLEVTQKNGKKTETQCYPINSNTELELINQDSSIRLQCSIGDDTVELFEIKLKSQDKLNDVSNRILTELKNTFGNND